jgi:hypothetical protein
MKFTVGAIALLAAGGASAFAPQQVTARSSSLFSTTAAPTYTFTKSEEIFAEALEVRQELLLVAFEVLPVLFSAGVMMNLVDSNDGFGRRISLFTAK